MMNNDKEKKNPLWILIHVPSALLCYWMAGRCAVGVHILTANKELTIAAFLISGVVFTIYIGMYISAATELIVKKLIQ